ncbi:MAG: pentapeptide repeat-containing protein [Hungatella sp.]|nr:pentapeptide repeat-containing protein [Hungatella sp.]
MDDNFKKEFREIRNQARLDVNAYYFSHMEELTDSYRESMAAACRQVKKMQAQGYQDVEFMEITMLRTRLLDRDFRVPILVYGPNWYVDPMQAQAGEIDAGGIFSFYEDMAEKTAGLVKKYRSKVPERMVEICMCQTADSFWNYVDMACRRAIMGFTPEGMGITEQFRVRICEYMGYGSVCRRHLPAMEQKQMKKWFQKAEAEVYRFRDFRGMDFSGWNFDGLDLTGCDFRDCNLDGCSFAEANLTGTWFCGSTMKGACFRDAWVPGARFDGANLEGAVFEGTYSSCRFNEEIWLRPDNEWASFAGCGLKNADFTFSAVECADFSNADVEGALFDEGHEEYYQLDEKQRGQAKFCEE